MFNNAFKRMPLKKRNLFQKLFHRPSPDIAVIEINNLLATLSIENISISEIAAIEKKNKAYAKKDFRAHVAAFYATYLQHCLKNLYVSDTEIKRLKMLKKLLSLDMPTILQQHAKVGDELYHKPFKEAISDSSLTRSETSFLFKLEKTFH
ncbi:hypothetical protein SAMN05421788_112151 [Filimonas lacunae]|uniref:Uncharacterized protein n=1 Tax=Filimonas lacunae TaxID=477680 RepID=A0A173ML33_9BACT|nr:hypothetical protein [Filimonas lacunae]BAV08343.1 hypothetical protein FLA_4379 [Filimonas lacunae]SIT33426.1 hypothetical protein SAMN05421788_112151 [Filimonas lacunae]